MEIDYKNHVSVEDFMGLRDLVGWTKLHREQIQTIIENSFFIAAAYEGGKAVGMARLISDGGYLYLVADVVVAPAYQRQGIGSELMGLLLQRVKDDLREGYSVCVALMSAKGMEGFYEKMGFHTRPNEKLGAGMTQWIMK